jgi:O-acetyl-ADP-ribose deacetylase (regulator of RNase III)
MTKERIIRVTKDTKKAIDNALEVVFLASATSAAVKVVSLPRTTTGVGKLPVWQVAGAVILAWVAYKVFTHMNKEV